MTDQKTIYTQTYTATILNINFNKKLGLFGMLGILQDSALTHATNIGFGYQDMVDDQRFWVLVRQRLRMKEWPNWHDVVLIKTWSRPITEMYAVRDYEIYLKDELIGECSTSWMILDGKTRKAVKPNFGDKPLYSREDYQLDFTAKKIPVPKKMKLQKQFEVRNSDLDLNNHVNNTRYSQWILDSIPIKYHVSQILEDFEINFLAETHLDDLVNIYSSEIMIEEGFAKVIFKGVRENDQRTVFTAKFLGKDRV